MNSTKVEADVLPPFLFPYSVVSDLKAVLLVQISSGASKLKATAQFMFNQPDDVRWFEVIL